MKNNKSHEENYNVTENIPEGEPSVNFPHEFNIKQEKFKLSLNDNIDSIDNVAIESKKENMIIQNEESKIKEVFNLEKTVKENINDYFDSYFFDEIGSINSFVKVQLSWAKHFYDDHVKEQIEENKIPKENFAPFDNEKYTEFILNLIFDKITKMFPDGINSFILQEPQDNNLTTSFLIVLNCEEEFFKKYNYQIDFDDKKNIDEKRLFKIKCFQIRFNNLIDEKKKQIISEIENKKLKDHLKRQNTNDNIEEILEKEKLYIFEEMIKDYSEDDKFTEDLTLLKLKLINGEIVETLDDLKCLKGSLENLIKEKGNINKVFDQRRNENQNILSPQQVMIELGHVINKNEEENADRISDLKNTFKAVSPSLNEGYEKKNLILEVNDESQKKKKNSNNHNLIGNMKNEENYRKKRVMKKRDITSKYMEKLDKSFEIFDINLKTMIRNYIALYVKKISEEFKLKNPTQYEEEKKKTQILKKKMGKKFLKKGFGNFLFSIFGYYEINFEDFLYLFLKILYIHTGLKIKLEIKPSKLIYIRLFYLENSYDAAAEYLEYKMQLKPYSKVYGKFFENCVNKKKDRKNKDKEKDREKDKFKGIKIEKENPNLENIENIYKKTLNEKDEKKNNDEENKVQIPLQEMDSLSKLVVEERKSNLNDPQKNKFNQLKNDQIDVNQNIENIHISSEHLKETEEEVPRVVMMNLEKSKDLMRKILKDKFEYDQVDLEDQHNFPPYFPFEFYKYEKFRKYLADDSIHECAKEEQYYLWVNNDDFLQSDSDEESENSTKEKDDKNLNEKQKLEEEKVFNVEKDFPCENCFYFRNIDRLRIISAAIDEVVNINELSSFEEIFKCTLLINNYSAYQNKYSLENLVWSKLNVYSEKSQGELIRLYRNFFGEKIAFYFMWYCFLLRYLIILMALSSIVFVFIFFQDFWVKMKVFSVGLSSLDLIYLIYSLIVGVWSTILMKAWKSKETLYAYIWGCDDFETYEPFRDEFIYDKIKTFIFNKRIPYQAGWKRFFKKILTFLIMLIIVSAMIVSTVGVFMIKMNKFEIVKPNQTLFASKMHRKFFEVHLIDSRNHSRNEYFNQSSVKIEDINDTLRNRSIETEKIAAVSIFDSFIPILSSLLIGSLVEIFRLINSRICKILTSFENYERNSVFDQNLIRKLIVLEFINNFNSMGYIFFIKQFNNQCISNNCINELNLQVYAVLFVKIIFRLIFILFKCITNKINKMKLSNTEDLKLFIQSEDHQMICSEYDSYYTDLNETIVLFAYTIFFSSSCPLTPLMVFLLGFINKNYDAFKFFNFYRMNQLEKSDGIGIYNNILRALYYLGLLSNISIVIFGNPYIKGIKLFIKFGILLAFVNFLLILSYVIKIDLHPNWFSNIYLFQNEYKKKYLNRPGPTYYHHDFIKDPKKKKKLKKKNEKNNEENNQENDNIENSEEENYEDEDYIDDHYDDSFEEENSYSDQDNDIGNKNDMIENDDLKKIEKSEDDPEKEKSLDGNKAISDNLQEKKNDLEEDDEINFKKNN